MSEQNKPFVVTDRRKFTLDGEVRTDADPSPEREERETPPASAPKPSEAPAIELPAADAESQTALSSEEEVEPEMIPGPTPEQAQQARAAYEATADRLETAIRASNPGADHPPPVAFETLVHSIYMSTMLQLGGATPEGQAPQVDIIGARQSIDTLTVLADKVKGNLTDSEQQLIESALFELRMGFLEITQAIARSAAARAGNPANPGAPGKPSIVR